MESLTTDNSVSDVHHTKINGVQSRLNSQYPRRSDGAHAVCNENHTFFPNMTEVMIRTSQLRLMRSEGRCKENYILTELALFLLVLFDGMVFDNLQCSSACTLPLVQSASGISLCTCKRL